MAVEQRDFKTISKKINLNYSKKISHIDLVIEVNDCGKDPSSESSAVPAVHFTDIMLQGGSVSTSWIGHVSEIKWSFDNA